MESDKERQRQLGFEGMQLANDIIRKNADVTPSEIQNEDGRPSFIVYYRHGWSDDRVAAVISEKMGREFKTSTIERFRRQHIGGLIRAKGAAPNAFGGVTGRLAMQAKTMAMALEQRMAERDDMLIAIYEKLGMKLPESFGAPPQSVVPVHDEADEEDAPESAPPQKLRVKRG